MKAIMIKLKANKGEFELEWEAEKAYGNEEGIKNGCSYIFQ